MHLAGSSSARIFFTSSQQMRPSVKEHLVCLTQSVTLARVLSLMNTASATDPVPSLPLRALTAVMSVSGTPLFIKSSRALAIKVGASESQLKLPNLAARPNLLPRAGESAHPSLADRLRLMMGKLCLAAWCLCARPLLRSLVRRRRLVCGLRPIQGRACHVLQVVLHLVEPRMRCFRGSLYSCARSGELPQGFGLLVQHPVRAPCMFITPLGGAVLSNTP